MADYYGLTSLGIVCALGEGAEDVWRRAAAGDVSGLKTRAVVPGEGRQVPFGTSAVPTGDAPSRVAALLAAAAREISAEVEELKRCYGPGRIGVVIGTSNSTMEEFTDNPEGYVDMNDPAEFLRDHLGLSGPVLSVSTACSSSLKVFASARKFVAAGICDAVVVGGADAFSRVVAGGFDSLEVLSGSLAAPLGEARDGINLGEGAALFTMEKNRGEIALLGVGESSDAHHLTAPDPEGTGAEASMRCALKDAGLAEKDIVYVNLHGTGTVQNDKMESAAVWRVFGRGCCCSSTKPMTGHALGAAGALETALVFLSLRNGGVLPHVLHSRRDASLPDLVLASAGDAYRPGPALSNSFAFGGSNASVIIGAPSPADVLPHDPPMVLITSIDPSSFTGDSLSAFVDIDCQSPFYDDEIGGISSSFALEYMAQTMAALVGLKRRRMRLPPRIGFVLGSRSLKITIPAFLPGLRYRIDAKLDFTDGSFASFDVSMSAPDGGTVATGRINAFEPDEDGANALKEGINT